MHNPPTPYTSRLRDALAYVADVRSILSDPARSVDLENLDDVEVAAELDAHRDAIVAAYAETYGDTSGYVPQEATYLAGYWYAIGLLTDTLAMPHVAARVAWFTYADAILKDEIASN